MSADLAVRKRRNKSGEIGTKGENAVVSVLTRNGFRYAERRRLRGRNDPGDITGTPGLAWSVKAGNAARTASDNQIAAWYVEAERMRKRMGEDMAILVVARKGIGYENADRWWAITTLETSTGPVFVRMYLFHACQWLRDAGYGTPRTEAAS